MAHSTSIPARQQAPKAQFDWYTFLRNAFLNGLKAYGAALMVAGRSTACESHLSINESEPAPRRPAPGKPQPSPALPHSTLASPALNQAWTRA